MVASRNYESYVKASVEAGADAIISGAGLPLDLPKYAEDKIMLALIVSSAKACRLLCRVWDKHHNTTPDFVIIEGQKAGGHLGFKKKKSRRRNISNARTNLKRGFRRTCTI